MVSKQSANKYDGLTQGLLNTRCKVVDLIKNNGHQMSFEEKRCCEWDLWTVHGILEFGYTFSHLQQAKIIMLDQGLDPQGYQLLI